MVFMRMPLLALLCVVKPGRVAHGHSSLIAPAPRNAVDRNLPAWSNGKFGNSTCEHPARCAPGHARLRVFERAL